MMTTELTPNYGPVGLRKEALVKDLKCVVDDADALLKEVVNSTAEEFVAARTKVEARLGEARSRLDDARTVVARSACAAADATQEYVTEHPWRVLGFAAAAGAVVCFLLDRR
jgi:ElaB/YqjD/DUF883 family membrane-anchored ribosome-binding protein